MKTFFKWLNTNRLHAQSTWYGPFAILKRGNDWVMLIHTEAGMFEIPITRVGE